jgi:hypothetical protein
MSWHVVQGMYYFSYGRTQPHILHKARGKNHAVIVFKITQGLISIDKTCNGLPASETNPEVHVDVRGINVIFVGIWGSNSNDEFFATGGQSRLYFDKGTRANPITKDQIVELEKIFKGQTANPSFEEFGSIPAASWLENVTTTQPTSITDAATTPGIPGNYKLITLPAQNVDVLQPNGSPAGTTKVLNPARVQLNPLERESARVDVEYQKLVNAAPKFRLGGQYVRNVPLAIDRSLDVEGTTLADSTNSFFVDPDLGLLEITGNGEYREFLYAGADNKAQHAYIMELLYRTARSSMSIFPEPDPTIIPVDRTLRPIKD